MMHDRTSNMQSHLLIGTVLIAGAILLSAIISTVGARYSGVTDQSSASVWVLDRFTGTVHMGGRYSPCRRVSYVVE